MHLTKSNYADGLKCSNVLWHTFNAPDKIPPKTPDEMERINNGFLVGALAKKLHKKGVEIERNNEAIQKTQALLKKRVPLFEASFAYKNCYCKADLLVPVHDDEWDLYEVKSVTEYDDEHIDDISFQRYVLQKAGLKLRKVHLMFVNNEYKKKGKLDLKKYFQVEDVSEKTKSDEEVETNVEQFLQIIKSAKPKILYGENCKESKKCPLCKTDIEHFEITNLYYFGKKAFPLINKGITKFDQIPKDVKLTEAQKIQIMNKVHINKPALKGFLDTLVFPLYFLDFETFAPVIPMYNGMPAYGRVPFQFSLHILDKNGTMKHHEFLAKDKKDPRPEFIKALKNVGTKGSVVVYNASFEKGVMEELAESFPKQSKMLHAIIERLVDLLHPFKQFWYYNPKQEGSCSIKYVLPAMTTSSYKHLEIKEGGAAQREFMRITFEKVKKEEKERIRNALLQYCKQDTQAMIDVMNAIKHIVS